MRWRHRARCLRCPGHMLAAMPGVLHSIHVAAAVIWYWFGIATVQCRMLYWKISDIHGCRSAWMSLAVSQDKQLVDVASHYVVPAARSAFHIAPATTSSLF